MAAIHPEKYVMISCWLEDMFTRVFPTRNRPGRSTLDLMAPRQGRTAFQVVINNTDANHGVLKVGIDVDAPRDIAVRARRVGFVPVPHHNTLVPRSDRDGMGHIPGYVPDPLFDETSAAVPPAESISFWFTVKPALTCKPGIHVITIIVIPDQGAPVRLRARVRVVETVQPARRGFPVVQWFYNDALCDWYKCVPFDERFWEILAAYMANLTEHGQDTIYAPVFTPPLDGVKRPTQLLHVTKRGNSYRFDWRDVKRYVDLARKQGIRNFEWTHLFTQWGVRHAIRIYEGQGLDEKLLWPVETPAISDTYRRFLSQFLPEFHRFLQREELLDNSFFHVSDEPHGEEILVNYRAARALLKELAPWMKTMDALSEIVYGREGVTDMPVASIATAKQFYDEKIPCFAYFCCGPRGLFLNRLIDTPLMKIRMTGWLMYRFRMLGFLHWGYNYWYKSQTRTMIDPFAESSGCAWPGWAYGDPFVVYPGPNGPLDSIRWETFAMSMDDYALLQARSIDPEGKFLASFQNFEKFPKDPQWFCDAYCSLLRK